MKVNSFNSYQSNQKQIQPSFGFVRVKVDSEVIEHSEKFLLADVFKFVAGVRLSNLNPLNLFKSRQVTVSKGQNGLLALTVKQGEQTRHYDEPGTHLPTMYKIMVKIINENNAIKREEFIDGIETKGRQMLTNIAAGALKIEDKVSGFFSGRSVKKQ